MIEESSRRPRFYRVFSANPLVMNYTINLQGDISSSDKVIVNRLSYVLLQEITEFNWHTDKKKCRLFIDGFLDKWKKSNLISTWSIEAREKNLFIELSWLNGITSKVTLDVKWA